MKRFITVVLSIVLFVSGVSIVSANVSDKVTEDEWKTNAFVSPVSGNLIGAGHIDIKWNNNLEDAKNYSVFVDSKLVKTITASEAEVMSVDYYTVKVSAHTAYIVAIQNDGTKVITSSVKFYVTKKGICVNDIDMGVAVDPADLNLGWYYNWGTKSFKETGFKNTKFYDLEFVPMFWGDPKDESYSGAFERMNNQGYKYVLGYNEPDLDGEAKFQPDVAMRRWKSNFVPNRGNLLLGSPAVSVFPHWSSWWSNYWAQSPEVSKQATNFIAVHNYQQNYSGKETALKYLEEIDECYSKYKKPMWITEFAVWKFSKDNKSGCAKTQEFMKIVLKGLNERSYVERYAWFSPDYNKPDASSSSLFDYSTGNLTTIGKMYAQIGNPSGYLAKMYGVPSFTNQSTTVASCVAAIKTQIFGLYAKKKAFQYEIQPVKGAVGYQLQYSLSKKFSTKKKYKTKLKYLKASNPDQTTGKIKKLKKKKRYYVRARAIKRLSGKNYYCSWSRVENVKTKK